VTALDDLGRFDAILLAGGRSSRLGGIDKTALRYRGATLLDSAVRAVAGARRTVIVGPQAEADVAAGVAVVREHPPFSGPAAALLTGVSALPVDGAAAWVVVLACDLVTPHAALDPLVAAIGRADDADGVIAVDDDGRRQPLLAVYRLSALRAIAGVDATGASLHRLLVPLSLVEVPVPSALLADVDTAQAASDLGIELPGSGVENRGGRPPR
jgi:molybdopterin-guanine dinucleotide biosynthesis protein A